MATTLTWDSIEERKYERGVDRVVIYFDNGYETEAIPWSGVVSISENQNVNTNAVYFEGNKVNTIVETDAYSANISALTYPEVVPLLEGNERLNHGIYLTNQFLRSFSMSYRTGIGSAKDGPLSDYRIHIVFGLVIVPQNNIHNTVNADPEVDPFEWEISSIPPGVGNYRPTSHIVLEWSKVPDILKTPLHDALYGDGTNPPEFSSVEDIIDQILSYSFWQFTDNEDGTFDATPFNEDDLTKMWDDEEFPDEEFGLYQLDNVEVEDLGDGKYLLLDGYGTTTECQPRTIGSIGETPGEAESCYHLVRSSLASDEMSHYIGTAPLGSQEIQPVWRVTQILFGPPVTIIVRTNIRWTEREV